MDMSCLSRACVAVAPALHTKACWISWIIVASRWRWLSPKADGSNLGLWKLLPLKSHGIPIIDQIATRKLFFNSFSLWKWPFDHLEVAQFSNKSILRPRKQCSLLGGWAIQNICSSIYGSSLIPDRLENHTWKHQSANLEQLFSSKLSTTFQNYRNYRSHCTLKHLTHIHVSDCAGSSSPSRLHETSVKLNLATANPRVQKKSCT